MLRIYVTVSGWCLVARGWRLVARGPSTTARVARRSTAWMAGADDSAMSEAAALTHVVPWLKSFKVVMRTTWRQFEVSRHAPHTAQRPKQIGKSMKTSTVTGATEGLLNCVHSYHFQSQSKTVRDYCFVPFPNKNSPLYASRRFSCRGDSGSVIFAFRKVDDGKGNEEVRPGIVALLWGGHYSGKWDIAFGTPFDAVLHDIQEVTGAKVSNLYGA